MPPDNVITPTTNQYAPYTGPITTREAMPTVTVTPESLSEFDITFSGDGGLAQQPLMSVVNLSDTPIAGASVTIMKQSSDAFRVNDPEPNNPYSTGRPPWTRRIRRWRWTPPAIS